MVDYDAMVKKAIAKINEDQSIVRINIYDIMFYVGTTQYVVARTVAQVLERKGLIKGVGRGLYNIVGRDD